MACDCPKVPSILEGRCNHFSTSPIHHAIVLVYEASISPVAPPSLHSTSTGCHPRSRQRVNFDLDHSKRPKRDANFQDVQGRAIPFVLLDTHITQIPSLVNLERVE